MNSFKQGNATKAIYRSYQHQLEQLSQRGQLRHIPQIQHDQAWIIQQQQRMLNLSSNDYLGLNHDISLRRQFFEQYGQDADLSMSSSSSRLLTGSSPHYFALESLMADLFQRESCVLFNSGYHANLGILSAIADKKTLIIADKLVHASMIDGIRLSSATLLRYQHQDYSHLQYILSQQHQKYERIIIVTESVFSMDGDVTDLNQLVALKQQFEHVMLYVDEAHAVGVYGATGLGMAEKQGCIQSIDFIVGAFGKALASMGGYVICDQVMRDYLVNFMRPLIFSTALPPLNVQWTYFLMQKMAHLQPRREHLIKISHYFSQQIHQLNPTIAPSKTCIIPYVVGDNQQTIAIAQYLQQQGYYCLPIRPPTVPQGTSRIRFSLTADLTQAQVEAVVDCLMQCPAVQG